VSFIGYLVLILVYKIFFMYSPPPPFFPFAANCLSIEPDGRACGDAIFNLPLPFVFCIGICSHKVLGIYACHYCISCSWVVVLPCGSRNPTKPFKLELVIYPSLQV
jgi:hypothetical protein